MNQRNVQLVLDFDGTLTMKDTIHLVAEAGYQRQSSTPSSLFNELPQWPDFVEAYISDYAAHSTENHQKRSQRQTLVEEAIWLDSLKPVEQNSAQRVKDAKIFDNVTKQDMETTALNALMTGNLLLRPGWAELLMAVHTINEHENLPNTAGRMSLQIISVNWSRWFVWSSLWQAASLLDEHKQVEQVKTELRKVEVFVNEINSVMAESKAPSSTNSGLIPAPRGHPVNLRTAHDKLKLMLSDGLHSSVSSSLPSMPQSYPSPIRIYIGDSATDLECLVTADFGICIRDSNGMSSSQRDLASTCARLSIPVKNLASELFDRNHHDESQAEYPLATAAITSGSDIVAAALEEAEIRRTSISHPLVLYYAHDFYAIAQWITVFLTSAM